MYLTSSTPTPTATTLLSCSARTHLSLVPPLSLSPKLLLQICSAQAQQRLERAASKNDRMRLRKRPAQHPASKAALAGVFTWVQCFADHVRSEPVYGPFTSATLAGVQSSRVRAFYSREIVLSPLHADQWDTIWTLLRLVCVWLCVCFCACGSASAGSSVCVSTSLSTRVSPDASACVSMLCFLCLSTCA